MNEWRLLKHTFLVVNNNDIKLHVGHIEISDSVEWKHNGDEGTIRFPINWLRQQPVEFYGVSVHVVKPQLMYVLKTNPQLMNPQWRLRKREFPDVERLRALLKAKQIDVETLHHQATNSLS